VNTAHRQSFALRAKPANVSMASSGSASVSHAHAGCPVCSTFNGFSEEAASKHGATWSRAGLDAKALVGDPCAT